MPPKKRIPKKKQAWLNIVNRAVEQGVTPVISQNRFVPYLRVPNVGRVDLERHGALTEAGKEYHRRIAKPFRAAQTRAKVDYENAKEHTTRDGLQKFIRGADGKPRYTQTWDPVKLEQKLTKHGRKYAAEATASIHVEIPVTGWVIETGRTWTDYLAWDKLSDTNEEVRVLRSTPNLQTHLRNILTPPGHGFSTEGTSWLSNAHDFILLLQDSEVRLFYSTTDPRPFRVRELVRQPGNSLKLQNLPNAAEAPVRFAFLRFPDQICAQAFEKPPPGSNCVVHQISSNLGIAKHRIEAIVDESVAERYTARDESNPYWDEFAREIVDWKGDGVTAESICDIAKRLNVACRILDCEGKQVLSHTPEKRNTNLRPIACTIHGQHIFMYSGEEAVRSIMHSSDHVPGQSHDKQLRNTQRDPTRIELVERDDNPKEWRELPDCYSYTDLLERLSPDYRYLTTHYIDDVRAELHRAGIVPIVTMKDLHTVRSLHWNASLGGSHIGDSRKISVYRAPHYWPQLQKFCEIAGVPWGGAGIGSCVMRAAQNCLRPKRKRLPEALIKRVFAQSGGKCASCGEEGAEIDHVIPISLGGTNVLSNLALNCVLCHKEKSNQELLEGSMSAAELYPLSSYMNPYTKQLFCDRPPVRAFVHQLRKKFPRGGALILGDTIMCRGNCLIYGEDLWPCFSPFDTVREIGCDQDTIQELGSSSGFMYIHKPLDQCPEPSPPWRGSDWYPIPVVRELLRTGRITWADITHKLIATGGIEPDTMRNLARHLQACADATNLAVGATNLASPEGGATTAQLPHKKVLNSLVGCWLGSEEFSYKCIQSTSKMDMAHFARGRSGYLKWNRVGERCVFDLVIRTPVHSATTCRPLGEYVLGYEGILLGRMIRSATQIPTCITIEMNTDGALFWCHANKAKRVEESILNAYHPDRAPIHRIVPDPELHLLMAPQRYKPRHDELVVPKLEWTAHVENGDIDEFIGRCFDDVKTRGCVLRAPPGCGKSTMAVQLCERLEASGIPTIRVAPTHTAARQMLAPSCTLHRLAFTTFARGKVPRLKGALVIDEIFACSTLLHCLLNALLTSTDVKILAIGDENQFAAVSSSWKGVHVEPETVLQSAYMHRLCNGVSLQLTNCRRDSGGDLFKLFMKPPSLARLRRKFPYTRPAETNLVVSHAYRKALIRWVQKWRDMQGRKRRLYEEDKKYPNSQNLYVCEGDRLLATKTAGNLLNGSFVHVLRIEEDGLNVRDDITGEAITVPHTAFAQHFVSAVAVTYQICQAKTITGTIALHQTGHKHFSRRHLLVGLSRATHISNLSIC